MTMVQRECARLLGAALMLGAVSSAAAQDLIGASVPSNGVSTLLVINPTTGAARPFMTVPVPAGFELRTLAASPGCGLAGTIYRGDTANNRSRLMLINAADGTSEMREFGPPLNERYAEAFDYSPRSGSFLLTFGPFGNFGTTNLARVGLDGAMLESAVIAGVSDMDTLASSPTTDVFMDLNRTSNPRIVQLATLFPSPTVTAFANPPSLTSWNDSTFHPVTNELLFTNASGSQFIRMDGNAYVNGAVIQGWSIRGLTYATLPPRAISGPDGAVTCPSGEATLVVNSIGTGPVTYLWQAESPPGSGQWTDLVSGGAGPGGTSTVEIAVLEENAGSSMTLTNASVGDEANFRCIITNSCGTATSPTALLTVRTCCPDVNCDGSEDQGDVACMILAVAGDLSCYCRPDTDFNQDGSADQGDVAAIIGVISGQPCP